jgi:hypothetical protein
VNKHYRYWLDLFQGFSRATLTIELWEIPSNLSPAPTKPVRTTVLPRAQCEAFSAIPKIHLRTLPNISMVTTPFPPPKKEAGRFNTLVNLPPIFTLLNGQYSADDNI